MKKSISISLMSIALLVSSLTINAADMSHALTGVDDTDTDTHKILRAEEASQELISAAYYGNTQQIQELLMVPDINVNAVNGRGYPALILASIHNHPEAVKLLLADPRIEINILDHADNTALMRAALNGLTNIVKLLLAAPGVDTDIQTKHGWDAIKYAHAGGQKNSEIIDLITTHKETCKILIKSAAKH